MSPSLSRVLGAMAAKGQRALDVASATCLLVTKGAELGELETITAADPGGDLREIRVMPIAWLDRLDRAIEVGAFERLEVPEIVDRILGPPPP